MGLHGRVSSLTGVFPFAILGCKIWLHSIRSWKLKIRSAIESMQKGHTQELDCGWLRDDCGIPDLRWLFQHDWSFCDTPDRKIFWQRSCIIMVECTSILICTLFALQLLWRQVAKVQHFPVDVDGISRISLFGTWLRTDLNRKTKRFRCCFECGYYPVSWKLASDYFSPRACYHSIDARLTVKDVDDIALCLAMWSALNKCYGDCFAYVLGIERAETTRETNIRQFYDVLWQATYSCN
jgi:hypothetical protein